MVLLHVGTATVFCCCGRHDHKWFIDDKSQMRKYHSNASMLLCKSYCFTMYCSPMWFDSTVTSMRKVIYLSIMNFHMDLVYQSNIHCK